MFSFDRDTPDSASAFPYRSGTKFCIHYYLQWSNPADIASRMADMARWYDSMRPFVPGAAYVNYCNAELNDWENAYWAPIIRVSRRSKRNMIPAICSVTAKAYGYHKPGGIAEN